MKLLSNVLFISSVATLCAYVHCKENVSGNIRTRQYSEDESKKNLRIELNELLEEQFQEKESVLAVPTELQVPHSNRQCRYAVPLGNSMSTSGTISTSKTEDFPSCFGASSARSGSAWYSVRADSWHNFVEVYNAGFPAQISVFTGSCGNLRCYNGGGDFVEFMASPGDRFYVAVHSACCAGDPVPYGYRCCGGNFEVYFRSM